jgi:TolB-like protein/DNA-binding winged helix-turn-helix (wHTH) protein/Flp pilus assembly protein TadD
VPGRVSHPEELQLDLGRYELRQGGRVLKLEKIPMELFILLAERKDQLVTREQIVDRLWGKEIFLDTEQGINTAVRKIRQLLRDDPEHPRFLETVVGKGYRLVGPVTIVAPTGRELPHGSGPSSVEGTSAEVGAPKVLGRSPHPPVRRIVGAVALFLVIAAGIAVLPKLTRLNKNSGPKAGPSVRSLAVLPLENLSGDQAQDYFADGMTDEIITNLAKVGSVRVISRTSVMQYKGVHKPLPDIARALGVDAVVEGSVVRSGERVRITAQLIYAPTDQHLWANEYERNLRDVLSLQSEVARTIAQEIRATVTPEERVRLSGKGAVNPQAYESYLKGRSYWNQRTEAGLGKAIAQFGKATELDPNYAEAYSGLADSYTALGYLSYLDPSSAFPKASAAATRALELDPTLAEAHASLAYYELYYEWNWVAAEREFKQAIALNPNYATAYEWYSIYLMAMGRLDESLAAINRARELDPLSVAIRTDVGFQYFYRRDYDRAVQELRATVSTNPRFPLSHLWLGRAYQQKHMYPEAIAEFAQTEAALPEWVVTIAGSGNAYGEWGKIAEAEQVLKQLNTMSQQKYVTPYGVALVYAGLGRREDAFAWLNQAVAGRSHWLVWLNLDPRWNRLRSDPRFAELVRQVGLP